MPSFFDVTGRVRPLVSFFSGSWIVIVVKNLWNSKFVKLLANFLLMMFVILYCIIVCALGSIVLMFVSPYVVALAFGVAVFFE